MFIMSGGYIFKSKLAVGRASFFILLLQGKGTVKNHRVPTDGVQLIFMDITSSDLVLKMKYSGDIQSEVVIPDLL